MFKFLKSEIANLSGARRVAAGALALYIVGWCSNASLTYYWEKVLEKQAPDALRQLSQFLANDLATGMALMTILVLFVPPVASFLFDASARLSRVVELRSRRMSRRDYIAKISREAVMIAQEARGVSSMGRWVYDEPSFSEMTPGDAWRARERLRAEQDTARAQALQRFVSDRSGRARFLMAEFVNFGYAKQVDFVFDHITNFHCARELGNLLEEAAHRAQSDLERDGYKFDKE
jgi:hypothetical protein